MSKLTAKQCEKIMSLHAHGHDLEEIAAKYKVPSGLIGLVVVGKYKFDTEHILTKEITESNAKTRRESPEIRLNRNNKKLTNSEILEIAERYKHGESTSELSQEFGISLHTVYSYLKQLGVNCRSGGRFLRQNRFMALNEFIKEIRKTLWRRDPGLKKKQYFAWKERIKELEATGMPLANAYIEASREIPDLKDIIKEYDLSTYKINSRGERIQTVDPPADSAPSVPTQKTGDSGTVKNLGKDQSHRENLNWAMESAGEFCRTGEGPKTCPNNAAFWLYKQACNEPEKFLTKVNMIETKAVSGKDDTLNLRKSQRSVDDINDMLFQLEEDEVQLKEDKEDAI